MAAIEGILATRKRLFESQVLSVCFSRKRTFKLLGNHESDRPLTARSGRALSAKRNPAEAGLSVQSYLCVLLFLAFGVDHDRAIRVKSANSLHDYLQMVLWFHLKSKTILQTMPSDSASSLNVQFADMLAGAVQSHFEFGNSDSFSKLGKSLEVTTLYF